MANIWHPPEMEKNVRSKRVLMVGETQSGGLLQNPCWDMKWDVQGEGGVGRCRSSPGYSVSVGHMGHWTESIGYIPV